MADGRDPLPAGMMSRLREAEGDLATARAYPPSAERDALVSTLEREIERRKDQLAERQRDGGDHDG